MIQVGDHLPQGQLVEFTSQSGKSAPQILNVSDSASGKKIAVLALPRVPSKNVLKRVEACRDQGVDEVWCMGGQDPAFVAAWERELKKLSGKIRLMSDGNGVYVQALGLSGEPEMAGNAAYRSSLLVDGSIVTQFNVDVSIRDEAANDGSPVVRAA